MSRATPDLRHVPKPSPLPSVPIGERVLELLEVAYRARRPVLLEGPTGIGKSQIVEQFARRAGIGYRVLDLSLLEPPDLVGLPQLRDGRTHYAFPAELPTEGSGVLMLEELNRAEIPVMQPALQLLSARRLHAYELPPGWFCVAAVNPEHDDYQVNRLDRALRSRFLELRVHAEPAPWLLWAASANVHPLVRGFITAHGDAFATSQPRSWAYTAEVLAHLTPDELRRPELVQALLHGYLPTAWATALASALEHGAAMPSLDVAKCFAADGPRFLQLQVAPLLAAGRTDAVSWIAFTLRRAAAPEGFDRERWKALVACLPGDLREQVLGDVERRRP